MLQNKRKPFHTPSSSMTSTCLYTLSHTTTHYLAVKARTTPRGNIAARLQHCPERDATKVAGMAEPAVAPSSALPSQPSSGA